VIFTGNLSIDTSIYSYSIARRDAVMWFHCMCTPWTFELLGIQLDGITFYRQSRGCKSNRNICTSGLFNELIVLSACYAIWCSYT